MGEPWTDEEIGTLLLEHDKPVRMRRTFEQLSKVMPCRSRNAVAGKIHRLGLSQSKGSNDAPPDM